MATVAELIRESSFCKAEGFSDLNPDVTVILPTFRRGDNGMFSACVDSLLAQTFKNFELIIIDDGSTDSTAERIREYMGRDARICTVRHPKNIGLPAVSEIEGFMRSRGRFFFFAFDDNRYQPEALETLFDFLSSRDDVKVVYAATRCPLPDGGCVYFGDKDFDFNTLCSANYLPNSPLLMRREMIDEFGVYDPHVSMARLCDWDLWFRIGRKYPFARIDKLLSEENGKTQSDSLENSYPVDIPAVRERMFFPRNDALKLGAVSDYEVDAVPADMSLHFQRHAKRIAETKYAPFFWNKGRYALPETHGKYLLLIANGFDASTDTFFSAQKTRVVCVCDSYSSDEIAVLIKGASAVVFSRFISDAYLIFADVCRRTGTPYYYYTDDNFFELKMQRFSGEIRRFLRGAAGFLFSSPLLADFFRAKGFLQESRMMMSLTFGKRLVSFDAVRFQNPSELRFLFASSMRTDGLHDFFGVLEKLKAAHKIKFFIFSRNEQERERQAFLKRCAETGIETEILDFEHSYEAFIEKVASKKIHFVLHPAGKNEQFAANVKYKTLNFMAVGAYASAFVFVPDIFPFSRVKDDYGLDALCYAAPDQVGETAERILTDRDYAAKLFRGQVELCEKELDPNVGEAVLREILENAPDAEKRPLTFSVSDAVRRAVCSVVFCLSFGKVHKKIKKYRRYLKNKKRFFKTYQENARSPIGG